MNPEAGRLSATHASKLQISGRVRTVDRSSRPVDELIEKVKPFYDKFD